LAQLEGQGSGSNSAGANKYVDYHFEASEFEKKLIQVNLMQRSANLGQDLGLWIAGRILYLIVVTVWKNSVSL
jgi:hypothetical protein